MKRIKTLSVIVPAAIILIILSFVFGRYDLDISLKIANEASPFGVFFEIVGELVAPLLCLICGLVLYYYSLKEKKQKNRSLILIFGFLLMIGGGGYALYLCFKVNLVFPIIVIPLIAAFIFMLCKRLNSMNKAEFSETLRFVKITLYYLVAMLVVINLFKFTWGRVRFRQLDGDLSRYTPFYQINGFSNGVKGYRSFPSGHTANATAIYVLTLLAPKCKTKLKKALCFVVPAVWIPLIAISRVMVGAHYASDVLYGFYISWALFYIVKYYTDKHSDKTKKGIFDDKASG